MTWWLIGGAAALAMGISWLRWRSAAIDERALAGRRALAAGELERAAEIFESMPRPPVAELARLYALRGDLDRAEQWAQKARRASDGARGADRMAAAARLLLVEILILCRRGRLDEARSALVREWSRFETVDGDGGWRAEACLVRGYLDAAAGAGVEAWLGLGEESRARVRWMAVEWPELRAFLDAYDEA